ncbi:MAG TPA: hypothetical protein VKU41_00915 [Polyangiaceae bacterium]|nr:hypothetical protein [Polyangiaceae bacterium]
MRGARSLDTLARLSPAASRVAAYVAALGMGGAFFYHLATHSQAYLGLFADDFFYYVVLADNLVRLGRLTFDGLTLTNGFHPLWFLIILVVRIFAGGLGTAFFAAVAVLLTGAMLATYEALRAFAVSLGASPAVAGPAAALLVPAANALIPMGMEIAVAIPLFAAFLALAARARLPLTSRDAVKLGVLGSLTVLARLDLALAVAMVVGAWLLLARPRAAAAARTLGAFACGGIALPLYLGFNLAVFGAMLPLSARAKQLRTSAGVNFEFLRGAWPAYGARNVALMLLALGALLFLSKRMPRVRPEARAVAAVALTFPVLFSGLNATLSDWFFFPWYAYPLPTAAVAAYAVVCQLIEPAVESAVPGGLAVVLAAAVMIRVPVQGMENFLRFGPGWSVDDNSLQSMAVELGQALKDRPGRLGMGDKAGITSFLVDRPIVQLEGLMADNKMLEHLRRQDPLDRIVEDYGIDYLVVSVIAGTPIDRRGGCYVVVAPNPQQAGPHSSKSVGKLCADPVIHLRTPYAPHSNFIPLETLVFDVRADKRATLGPP